MSMTVTVRVKRRIITSDATIYIETCQCTVRVFGPAKRYNRLVRIITAYTRLPDNSGIRGVCTRKCDILAEKVDILIIDARLDDNSIAVVGIVDSRLDSGIFTRYQVFSATR